MATAPPPAPSFRSIQTANSLRSPLEIRTQHSLAQERFASNGVQKIVHVVVKNQPFLFELAFAAGARLAGLPAPLDFNRITVNAELVYDNDDLHRVDFVKKKPIEFKAHISDAADAMTIEMRMKVLSSQLEDMHFRVRFSGVDSVSKEALAPLVCYSEPIKVVSKPEQVHKIQAPAAPRPRKRKAPGDLDEVLERIEQHQREQRDLLNKLIARDSVYDIAGSLLQHCIYDTTAPGTLDLATPAAAATATATTTTTTAAGGAGVVLPGGQTVVDPGQAFESLFQQLLVCYSLLNADERPAKIRKVVLNTPSRETEKLSELLDQFQYEVRRDATRSAPSSLMPPHDSVSPHSSLMAAMRHPPLVSLVPTSAHNGGGSGGGGGGGGGGGHNGVASTPTTPCDFDKIDEYFTKEFLSLPAGTYM